ncbi:uncharacterized protein LOC124852105 [Hippoglossus stenolepis]|uniref:uncharacterized protein LOC124852105 n=1 Tax=Hippoglossus stenolepis TaxID=195615 RepID=UPI001FAFFB67|nr:uncharacterized protein LOC124852105 [Hippoglossus stenolepis]
MSATNGRRAKAPPESQKAASVDQAEPPNLSFIDKASFMEGLQLNDGNPLHSTAMEEDLNVLVEGQMDKGKAGRGDDHQMLKKKQRGAAVRREVTETGGEKRKISRRNPAEKFKARPEKGAKGKKKKGEPEPEVPATAESDTSVTPHTSTKPPPKANIRRQVIAKRRSAGKTSASRPLKKQQMKDMKRKNESDRGNSIDSESQQESNTGQHSRSRVLSSDEEVDEGTYWKPSPKKARVFNLGKSRKSSPVRSQPRKSSSGSASAVADSSSTDKQRSKRRGRQATTDLEVVLDAFLDFCDEYRDVSPVAVAVANSKPGATVENVQWQNTHGRRPEGRGRESVARAKHLNLPCESPFTVDSDAVFSLRLTSRPPVLPDLQLFSLFRKLLTGYYSALPSSPCNFSLPEVPPPSRSPYMLSLPIGPNGAPPSNSPPKAPGLHPLLTVR